MAFQSCEQYVAAYDALFYRVRIDAFIDIFKLARVFWTDKIIWNWWKLCSLLRWNFFQSSKWWGEFHTRSNRNLGTLDFSLKPHFHFRRIQPFLCQKSSANWVNQTLNDELPFTTTNANAHTHTNHIRLIKRVFEHSEHRNNGSSIVHLDLAPNDFLLSRIIKFKMRGQSSFFRSKKRPRHSNAMFRAHRFRSKSATMIGVTPQAQVYKL